MTHHPPDAHTLFRLRKALWRWRNAGPRRLFHMARRRAFNPAYIAGVSLWLVGCVMQPAPPPTPLPTATAVPTDDDTWTRLAPGLEQRVYRPPSGLFTRLTAIRIDPARYTFRVHYQPGEAYLLTEWAAAYPDAAVLFNTNFFDREDVAQGLLFADGVRYGESYRRRGGTFFVQNGVPGIESVLVRPYAGEPYEQAAQAFPMLITDGAQSYFDTRPDRATRRTVIGMDSEGRVVVLVTSFGGITLLDLAAYLAASDLGLVDALNLDGGGSSMLQVQAGDTAAVTVGSFDPVPAVMGVYPRPAG